jgi:hypothetical protein
MTRKTITLVGRVSRHDVPGRSTVSDEERQRMIREAAYYRYVQRGYADGHDLEDWVAAEAELAGMDAGPQAAESATNQEFEVQQSSTHGFRHDEALKRIIRQHPQKGIPQVEGIDLKEAPAKE